MKKATKIDLSLLNPSAACDKPVEIELLHPASREPLGIFISVVGLDSSVIKDVIADFRRANAAKAAAHERQGRGGKYVTPESAYEEFIMHKAVAATLGWRTGDTPALTLKGEDLPYSVANVRKVYADAQWIQMQVLQGVDDLLNFMPS